MRTGAAPFPLAPDDAVRFTTPWRLESPNGSSVLGGDTPGWDYLATLDLSAVVEVDTDAVRERCHLGPDSLLRILVTASSSTTKMRGPVAVRDVESGPIPIRVKLVGHELGGRLALEILLVAAIVERIDTLSPRASGSILWRHRQTSWLEGDSARFPTEVADLSASPYFTPGALWFVDMIADDLDSVALGSVRLILNGSHPTVERILVGDPSSETTAILSVMQWDVARQLILKALDDDEFVERGGGFEEDTLGAMLSNLLNVYWPGESARALRQVRAAEPERFERELQDRVGLLR